MKDIMPRTERAEIDTLLELSRSPDASTRVAAMQRLCPCHVKRNEPRVWERVLQLVDDPSHKVRVHVFHMLADGSPRERESEVVNAIERLTRDPHESLRRRARKLMAHYRRGGKINIL